jgi:RNA polymerase sigma factor (sigma-70 family)
MANSKEKKAKRPRFEDVIKEINTEIQKRKGKWNLTILSWMDFDDVAQVIRIHIYKKWHLYDPSKPLGPWLNRIISNQIKNLIRNNYGNFSRPCLKCAAAEGEDLCFIYQKQCNTCPLYANWEKSKKRAHDTKLPVSLENHSQEVYSMSNEFVNVERSAEKLHKKMKKILKPQEWLVYEKLYVKHMDEEKVAKAMGYKTSEKNRSPGYKQLKNIKKSILKKAKGIIYDGDIDIL